MSERPHDEYKCTQCGGVFTTTWSDAEANAEANLVFGKPVEKWIGGAAIVCDDCYRRLFALRQRGDA